MIGNYEWFFVTFPLLTIVYRIAILLAGLKKVQWTVDVIRLKRKKWYLSAISATVSIFCAIIIIKITFTSTAALIFRNRKSKKTFESLEGEVISK